MKKLLAAVTLLAVSTAAAAFAIEALSGITEDLDGNPRFVDDPDTTDSGSGTPPIVDMGAYEFQGASPCPWDCESVPEGTVGINDFRDLLAQWGGPGSCDFDGGGVGAHVEHYCR